MQRAVHAHVGDTPQHATSTWPAQLAATELFTPMREQTLPHLVHGDIDSLLTRVASVSYIAVLRDREREHLLNEVRAIVTQDPQTLGRDKLVMPYVTHVAWCHPRWTRLLQPGHPRPPAPR